MKVKREDVGFAGNGLDTGFYPQKGEEKGRNYRHGDLALIGIDKLPEGLKKSSSKVLMTGSGGNDHSFDNGEFYPHQEQPNIIGYFVANNTTLFHAEHGKVVKGKKLRKAKIQDGNYQLRGQIEDTHSGMKPVID